MGWAAATELCEPSWLICEAMAPSCGRTQGDMHGIREICSLCWQIYKSARIHLIRLLNMLFSNVCVLCWENTGAEAFNNWVRGTKCVRCGYTAYVLFLTTASLNTRAGQPRDRINRPSAGDPVSFGQGFRDRERIRRARGP